MNSRIVVVGSSEVAISFLEQLVYSPHLHFTNLVLVSLHGLSISPPSVTAHNPWCTTSTAALLGLNTWVNVLKGKLTFINRSVSHSYRHTHVHVCVITCMQQRQFESFQHSSATHIHTYMSVHAYHILSLLLHVRVLSLGLNSM